jgi:hypothetical protein
MPALGHNGYLAMVKEVTWGTDPGSGYTSQSIMSEGMDFKQAFLFEKPIQGTRSAPLLKVPGAITAGGAINFDADVEGILGLCLKGILSAEATVDNGAGNGGNHTFTPSNTVPPSFSVLVNRDSSTMATNIWDNVGCTVDKLDLSAADGGLLKAVATLSAKTQTASATGISPSYTTQNPLVYHTGTMSIAGSSSPTVNVKSFKLSINSGNHNKRPQLGSKTIQQQQPGLFSVTGEVDAYFDSMTLVNDYINATDVSIELLLTGTAVGSSTRKLDLLIPVAQFTEGIPKNSGAANEIMLKLPFTAWLSGAGSPNALIQALLVNSQRTAY